MKDTMNAIISSYTFGHSPSLFRRCTAHRAQTLHRPQFTPVTQHGNSLFSSLSLSASGLAQAALPHSTGRIFAVNSRQIATPQPLSFSLQSRQITALNRSVPLRIFIVMPRL
ncbi:hypothetical protein HAX54_010724 [Datura stramonium]|uniref:Uncharacterized protein n=1 Tax=Datura stramonium TaxID=4076 RepID=A0ABS8TGT6_DATST|nr:hypothetical protein [Datura stramonium]